MSVIKLSTTPSFHIIDLLVYIATSIVTLLFLFGIDYSNADTAVVISFLAIGIYSFIAILRPGRCLSIHKMYFIFNYIFFFMAGLQIYCSGEVLWLSSGMLVSYTASDYLTANIMIMLASICFDFAYTLSKSGFMPVKVLNKPKLIDTSKITMSNNALYILVAFSTIALIILILTKNIFGENTEILGTSSTINSQLPKMLRYIPVSTFILYVVYRGTKSFKKELWVLLVLGIEILICFFPLGHLARFFLLGTYLVLVALLFSDIKYKSFIWALMFFGFCFLFSDLKSIGDITCINFTTINFVHVDFDAHQFVLNCIKHTDKAGICYGLNILSAFAFLIPRSIWTDKMESTGAIVSESFHSRQGNVSSPLVGELYFAFSWFGVVFFSLILGYIIQHIDTWFDSKNGLKRGTYCILAGMIIYILRGSLLSTMAYTLALILTLVCAFVVVIVFNKRVPHEKR